MPVGVSLPVPFRSVPFVTLFLDKERVDDDALDEDMIAELIKLDRQFRSPVSFPNYAAEKR